MTGVSNGTFPCKDCGDRKVGCHSTCEKYTTAKAVYEKKVADQKEIDGRNGDVDDFRIKAIMRAKERNRRRK